MIEIIGFEYICNLFGISYTDISDKLKISKQTINSWTSRRRNIPQKYLPVLSKEFRIPEEYFQKELTEIDKINIQKTKLNNEINFIDEVNMFDPETADEIGNLNFEIKKRQIISKIDESFKNCRTEQELLIKYLDSFLDILFSDDVKDKTAIRDTIGALKKYYGVKGGIMPNRFVRDIIHALEERAREKKKK